MVRIEAGRRVAGAVLALAAAAGLAACVPPGAGRPGFVSELAPRGGTDAGDTCGPQVVVFVNAADVLGAPRRGGAATAAQLAAEVAAENAAIDRLQIAFDALLYCRWTEVRLVRAEAAAGRVPAPQARERLAQATGRFRRDLGRAGQARAQLADRSARLVAAAEAVAPGTRAAATAARQARRGTRAVASAPVPLRLQAEGGSPEVGRLRAGQEATLTPAPGGFVFAEAGSLRGYAPGGAFTVQAETSGGGTDLRTLVASNIAKREAFAESLTLAERSAESNFETSL